jgi:hypothetical protein
MEKMLYLRGIAACELTEFIYLCFQVSCVAPSKTLMAGRVPVSEGTVLSCLAG